MRDYPGVTLAGIDPLDLDRAIEQTRQALGVIDVWARDVGAAMKRIQLGQIPTGGGDPLPIDLSGDFFFLPGRFGGQTAHFATESGGSGTLASTKNSTKGFIYLGNAHLGAFDEANVRLGVNKAAPAARLQLHSDNNPGTFGYPGGGGGANPVTGFLSNPALGTGSWANVDDVTADDNSTYNYADSIQGNNFPTVYGDQYTGTSFTADSPRSGWKLRARIALFDNIGGGTHDWSVRMRITGPGPGYSDAASTGLTSIQSLTGYAIDTWFTWELSLSGAEMAAISTTDYRLIFDVQPSSGGIRNTQVRLSQFHLEVDPSGGADTTPLQRWSLAASSDVLDATYASNGASGFDLTLTGNNTLFVGSGGGTSGVRLLTSSTNGRIEAGTTSQTNMNLVLSGNRDATGTLLTSKFTTHEFTGALKWDGSTSGALTHQAAATTTSHTLTWPSAQGAASSFLTNNGSGTLSWQTSTGSAFLHELLSASHSDTVAQTVSRGSLIYGNSTPKWDELTIGAASTLLKSDGTDASWGTVSLLSAFHGDTTAGTVVRGDLVTGQTATPKWQRLAIGGSGTVLRSDGTDVSWASPSAAVAHTVLDGAVHTDTVTQTVSRGSLIYGNSTPKWDELTIGSANTILRSDGTDVAWSAFSGFTSAEFLDSAFRVLGSSDATKKLAFEVDGLTTATTRTLTPQDQNYILAGTNIINTFTVRQVIEADPAVSQHLIFRDTNHGGDSKLESQTLSGSDRIITTPDADGTLLAWNAGTAGFMPDAGSLVYAAGVNSPMTELAIGSASYILTSSGTAPQWTSNADVVDLNRSWQNSQFFKDTKITIVDDADSTKTFLWSLGGASANADATLAWSGTADRTITLPDATGTLLAWNAGTPKNQPLAGSLVYGAGATTAMSELAIGAADRILTSTGSAPQWSTNASVIDVARTWATLQTFKDTTIKIVDDADSTKTLAWSLGGASASADLTLAWAGTADRTVTYPDSTTTLAGLGTTQTWTGTNLFLAPLQIGTSVSTYGEFDTSLLTAARIFIMPDSDGTIVLTAATQTLTNKTLSSGCVGNTAFALRASSASSGFQIQDNTTTTKRLRFVVSGVTSGADNNFEIRATAARTWTFEDAAGIVATDAGTLCIDGDVVTYDDDLVLT